MNQNLLDKAKEFRALKDEYEEKNKALKELGDKWDEVEKELIQLMLDDCINSIDVDGVGKVSLATTSYLSVNAANKPQFFDYLQESGNGGLLKLDVHPKTLTSFLGEHRDNLVKDFMAKGFDEVDAKAKALEFLNEKGANYFVKRGIQLRKGK